MMRRLRINCIWFLRNERLPMETQSVQESRHALHSDKNDGGEDGPWSEKYENGGATDPRIHLQTVPEHHRPEHFRQFCTQRAKRWNRSGYCHFWGWNKPFGDTETVIPTASVVVAYQWMTRTWVRQTEGPQSQVGSRVWHALEDELNGVDGLVPNKKKKWHDQTRY